MRWLFIFLSVIVLHSSHGFLCPACDENLCPSPTECPGGLALDNCDCCFTCAKTLNESCGGEYGLSGKCDKGLICAISPQHGSSLSSTEDGLIGICQECSESFEGCTIMESECVCDTSCSDIFEFADKTSCLNYLAHSDVSETEVAKNCSDVQCGVMFMPQCPPDSVAVKSQMDGCCPLPPTCECRMEFCSREVCAPGSELTLIRGGLGTPGRCCDEFECTPPENHCRDVHCPLDELADIDCPSDSYRLPSLVTSDGCCLVHQGCQCLADSCPPVECPAGTKISILSPALRQPGFCCAKFKCVNNATIQSCEHEGIEFQHEERFNLDKCTTCTCRSGLMFCKMALCENQPRCDWMGTPEDDCCPVCLGCMSTYGKLYANNETWFEDDWCTSCRCDNGQLHCIASSCMVTCHNPRKVPGQCCPVCDDVATVTLPPPQCPLLTNCSLECAEGLQQDDNGCYLCQCKPVLCDLRCPNGLMTDDDGQEICMCAPVVDPCPPLDECFKQCPYGLKRGRNGCLRCRCNKCPPFMCKKKCPGKYARSEQGCKLCRCAGKKDPFTIPTTASSSTTLIPSIHSTTRSCVSSDGRQFDDGETWSDGCRTCFCQSSREMCVLLNCPLVKCDTPVIVPGDCCPSCPDQPSATLPSIDVASCQSEDGLLGVEGESWQLDRCTRCLCHNNRVLCDSERCPPLLCTHPVHLADRCCPHCPGDATEVLNPAVTHKSCMSHNRTVFEHGDIWRVNPCQSCMCQYGQVMCYSQTCPPLKCTAEAAVIRKGQCCPMCTVAGLDFCIDGGIVFDVSESWQRDVCTTCSCQFGGTVLCTRTICPVLNCVSRVTPEGRCCPVCRSASESQNTTGLPGLRDPVSIALIVVAILASVFAVVIIVLVVIKFRRRFRSQRYHTRSDNNATLVSETKRPKSTNLDLQGIMPLLVDNTTTNKNMTNNVYDVNMGEKRWSSEVEKRNSDNLKTKEDMLKDQIMEDDIELCKQIQQV